MKRRSLNKGKYRHNFNKQTSRTKAINVAPPPMRGGIRL